MRRRVVIEVADTGPGIEPAVLASIFEPFTRGKESVAEGGGLGVGLSIVRSLVDMHGGTVEASRVGEGTVFLVSLPPHAD